MTVDTEPVAPPSPPDTHAAKEGNAGEIVYKRDTTYGWGMYWAFVLAVLAITAAVGVLAMVGSWWMLGIAIAIHLTITSIMLTVIFDALSSPSDADRLTPISSPY